MIATDDSASGAQSKSSGVLQLVATPIGNLQDITLRAIEALKSADAIACEDTRTSGVLLRHYEVTTPLVAYHEHNAEKMRPKLLARLTGGETIALISDAGTPLISDPGYKLVREAQAVGVRIEPIPGACAAITGLCASGLPTHRFAFLGFLPTKASTRTALLNSVSNFPGTLICYESPKRTIATLREIASALGEREVALARELTKRFEELLRLPIAELIAALEARESLKGEVVLLIGEAETSLPEGEALDALLRDTLKTHGTKEAARLIAAQTGASKSELYSRALELKDEDAAG